jgi:urease accessory protein
VPDVSATRWRLLQIADSSFPTGGFAHSSGLEAAVSLGVVQNGDALDAFVRAFLWNAGQGSLPFVAAAYDDPARVWHLDAEADALLVNHVANRASRVQGRTFVATCQRVFGGPDLGALAELAARARAPDVAAHVAPLFGAALAWLAVDRIEALSLFVYFALRGVTSAAVRLGAIGPLEAQRLVSRLGGAMDAVVASCGDLPTTAAATVAPVLEVVSACHDHLPARLFQS